MKVLKDIGELARESFSRYSAPVTSIIRKVHPDANHNVRAGVEITKTVIHGAMTIGSAGFLAIAFAVSSTNNQNDVDKATGGIMKLFFGVATCAFARRTYVHGRDGIRALRQSDDQAVTQSLKREI